MRATDQLLKEIESFIKAQRLAGQRLSDTTFGRLAVNDGKFVGRLRNGGTVTLPTAERIRSYMRKATPTSGVAA